MSAPTGHATRRQEQGVIGALVAVLLLVIMAALALVVETGSAVLAHRRLLDAADAAARAGASALDVATYRASDGRIAQLDPQQATTLAREYLARNGHHGEHEVTATITTVTVRLVRDHPPLLLPFLPPVRLTATATAAPQTGITQGAQP